MTQQSEAMTWEAQSKTLNFYSRLLSRSTGTNEAKVISNWGVVVVLCIFVCFYFLASCIRIDFCKWENISLLPNIYCHSSTVCSESEHNPCCKPSLLIRLDYVDV